MKLSEAIRLGAMLRPQAYGRSFDNKGGSCALGAAQEAMGLDASQWLCFQSSPWYPFFCHLIAIKAQCPACWQVQTDRNPGGFLIPHLNDDHRWTRERIADWVESIEPKDVQTEEEVAHDPAPVAVPASWRG